MSFEEDLRDFRNQLDDFVFFHLGSDAVVETRAFEAALEVSIEHPRVRSFRFRIGESEMARLSSDPRSFEEFMLDHLTANRLA